MRNRLAVTFLSLIKYALFAMFVGVPLQAKGPSEEEREKAQAAENRETFMLGFRVQSVFNNPGDAGNRRRLDDCFERDIADVNGYYGRMPILHIAACIQGDPSVANRLLDLGADPNHVGRFSEQTALAIALGRDDKNMAQALYEGGADTGIVIEYALGSRNQFLYRKAVEFNAMQNALDGLRRHLFEQVERNRIVRLTILEKTRQAYQARLLQEARQELVEQAREQESLGILSDSRQQVRLDGYQRQAQVRFNGARGARLNLQQERQREAREQAQQQARQR